MAGSTSPSGTASGASRAVTATTVAMISRSGKPLGRYFPEVLEILGTAERNEASSLDGELIMPLADRLDFEALQMRLHPAESRIRKLAKETPAELMLFDVSGDRVRKRLDDQTTGRSPARRSSGSTRQMPSTDSCCRRRPADRDVALGWLERSGGALDGVVAKRLDQPYRFGERAMIKVKQLRTADCVVGGFRYAEKKREVGSLAARPLRREGLLHHVGFTSAIRREGAARADEEARGADRAPGFTGNAPGGPSRWNTERSMASGSR